MIFLARLVSVLTHPILVVFYAFLLLICVNPYLFSVQEDKQKVIIIFSIFFLSVVFPLLSVLLMRSMGLIKNLRMDAKTDRIVPLVITGIFYLWLFLNIKNNPLIPEAFTIFVLGANISLFVAFFINNFSKISLHSVGMGGIIGIVIIVRYFFSYENIFISLGEFGDYAINLNLLVILAIFMAGIVGSSRLILGEHRRNDIFGGYLVGLLGQLISFSILFGS